jgi:DNA-directed RNA polymerase subunit RPC12/RpoP
MHFVSPYRDGDGCGRGNAIVACFDCRAENTVKESKPRADMKPMCPKCGSSFLLIKHKTFSERFMIAMTGRRKYCCQDCGTFFRAQDRRKLPREEPSPIAPGVTIQRG